MEVALEAGADDIRQEGDSFVVVCPPESFTPVQEALQAAGIEADSKELTRIPSNTVEVTDVETAKSVLKLMETLDDHDDVQSVSSNFNIPDEAMAAIATG